MGQSVIQVGIFAATNGVLVEITEESEVPSSARNEAIGELLPETVREKKVYVFTSKHEAEKFVSSQMDSLKPIFTGRALRGF